MVMAKVELMVVIMAVMEIVMTLMVTVMVIFLFSNTHANSLPIAQSTKRKII
jgi:hypothetical protein